MRISTVVNFLSPIRSCAFLLILSLPGAAFAADTVPLRMLIWDGYAPAEAQRRFQRLILEQYDVKVDFQIENASNPDNYFNKIRSGLVDIISPVHNRSRDSRYNLTENGLTLPINLDNVHNYRELIPELAWQDWAMNGGEVFAVPIVHGFYSLAYNSSVIPEPPDSWAVLWDQRYDKKFAINIDYYELNVYITLLALDKRQEDIFQYDTIKGEMLERKLHYLAQHAKSFWRGYDQPEHYQDLALSTSWRFTFPAMIPGLQEWRIAEPKEGPPWTIDTIMLGNSMKFNGLKKKIAELWINFLLEPENQLSIFVQSLGTCPVTTEAWEMYTQKILNPSERDRLNRLFTNLIPWQILEKRDRNAFHLLWKEALAGRSERTR